MTGREAFLQAICENPADDAPRLMFADWLTERGDPRGDEIRDAIQDPQRGQYTANGEMVRQHRPGAGAERFPPDSGDWIMQVRGGFVEAVWLPFARWISCGPDLVRAAPLREVRLSQRTPYPNAAGKWLWVLQGVYRDVHTAYTLPDMLFDQLQGNRDPLTWRSVRWYATNELAEADFSSAALKWARGAAGLH